MRVLSGQLGANTLGKKHAASPREGAESSSGAIMQASLEVQGLPAGHEGLRAPSGDWQLGEATM